MFFDIYLYRNDFFQIKIQYLEIFFRNIYEFRKVQIFKGLKNRKLSGFFKMVQNIMKKKRLDFCLKMVYKIIRKVQMIEEDSVRE